MVLANDPDENPAVCDDGTVAYASNNEICCEGTKAQENECCNDIIIDPGTEACCGGAPYDTDDSRNPQCCGDEVDGTVYYDEQQCCDDLTVAIFADDQECCGTTSTTAVHEDDCCDDGDVATGDEVCCDDGMGYSTVKDPGDCCGDKIAAEANEVCCDDGSGTTTSTPEDDCCEDLHIRSGDEICCDDGSGSSSAMTQEDCCDLSPLSISGPSSVICTYQSDSVTALGGVEPYYYSSSDYSVIDVDADTGSIKAGSIAGSAEITVTDVNGCSATTSVSSEDRYVCGSTGPDAGTLSASGTITLEVGDTYSFNSNDVTVLGSPGCGTLKNECTEYDDSGVVLLDTLIVGCDYELSGDSFTATQVGDFTASIFAEVEWDQICEGKSPVVVKIGDIDITVEEPEDPCPAYSSKQLGPLSLNFSSVQGTSDGQSSCSFSTSGNLNVTIGNQSVNLTGVSIEWTEDSQSGVVSDYEVSWTGSKKVTVGAIELELTEVVFDSGGTSEATLNTNLTSEVAIGPQLKLQPLQGSVITYTFSGSPSSGTWDFSSINDLSIHLVSASNDVLAKITAQTLSSDGKVSNASFALEANATFQAGSFTAEMTELSLSMDFNILSSQAQLNNGTAKVEITDVTGLDSGSRMELALTIDDSNTYSASVSFDLNDTTKTDIQISELKFAGSISAEFNNDFSLTTLTGTSLEISHSQLGPADGGNGAAMTDVSFSIKDGALESLSIGSAEIVYKNKFRFAVDSGSYSNNEVQLSASIEIGSEFSFELDSFSKGSGNFNIGQITVDFNRSPLQLGGDFSYNTSTDNFSGNLDAYYDHNGSSYGMSGSLAFGSAEQGSSSHYNYAYGYLSISGGSGIPLGTTGLNINKLSGEAGYKYSPSDPPGGPGTPDSSVIAVLGAGMGIRDTAGLVQLDSHVRISLGDDSTVQLLGDVKVPATGATFANGSIDVKYSFGSNEVRGFIESSIQVPAGSGSAVQADSGSVEFAASGRSGSYLLKAENITGQIFSVVDFDATVRLIGGLNSADTINTGTVQGSLDYEKIFQFVYPEAFDSTDCVSADGSDSFGFGVDGQLEIYLGGSLNANFDESGVTGSISAQSSGSSYLRYKWPCLLVICSSDCLKEGNMNFSGNLLLEKTNEATLLSGELTFNANGESDTAQVNFEL